MEEAVGIDDVVSINVVEVGDGYVAEVTLADGWCVAFCDNHVDGVTLKVRNVALPKVGQFVTVGSGPEQRTVKVKRREFDSNGHVFAVDEMGHKYRWA